MKRYLRKRLVALVAVGVVGTLLFGNIAAAQAGTAGSPEAVTSSSAGPEECQDPPCAPPPPGGGNCTLRIDPFLKVEGLHVSVNSRVDCTKGGAAWVVDAIDLRMQIREDNVVMHPNNWIFLDESGVQMRIQEFYTCGRTYRGFAQARISWPSGGQSSLLSVWTTPEVVCWG
jgi:hypothetical protein